jgi:hypothetical protein
MDVHPHERGGDGPDVSGADYRVTLIPREAIAEVWPVISTLVAMATRHGGAYEAADVKAALEAGDWQLWGDGRSICCTRVAEYPKRRLLFVMLASGGLESVEPMWPTIKAFGQSHGCGGAKAFARPGFSRSGRLPVGWRHTQDVVTVEW